MLVEGGWGQKWQNVINNMKKEGEIYKHGIDGRGGEGRLRGAGNTEEAAGWEVGAIMGKRRGCWRTKKKKTGLCSSKGLNSLVESGCANLVLPPPASRSAAEYPTFPASDWAGVTGGR